LADQTSFKSYIVQDDLGRDFMRISKCFTCEGRDFKVMMRHVQKHIDVGENIHISVMKILGDAYHEVRTAYESEVGVRLHNPRSRGYIGGLPRDKALEKLGYNDQPWSPKFQCMGCKHISKGHTDYTSDEYPGKKQDSWHVKCSSCGEYHSAAKWERLEGWKERYV